MIRCIYVVEADISTLHSVRACVACPARCSVSLDRHADATFSPVALTYLLEALSQLHELEGRNVCKFARVSCTLAGSPDGFAPAGPFIHVILIEQAALNLGPPKQAVGYLSALHRTWPHVHCNPDGSGALVGVRMVLRPGWFSRSKKREICARAFEVSPRRILQTFSHGRSEWVEHLLLRGRRALARRDVLRFGASPLRRAACIASGRSLA